MCLKNAPPHSPSLFSVFTVLFAASVFYWVVFDSRLLLPPLFLVYHFNIHWIVRIASPLASDRRIITCVLASWTNFSRNLLSLVLNCFCGAGAKISSPKNMWEIVSDLRRRENMWCSTLWDTFRTSYAPLPPPLLKWHFSFSESVVSFFSTTTPWGCGAHLDSVLCNHTFRPKQNLLGSISWYFTLDR